LKRLSINANKCQAVLIVNNNMDVLNLNSSLSRADESYRKSITTLSPMKIPAQPELAGSLQVRI
jgi:hypothetical protein